MSLTSAVPGTWRTSPRACAYRIVRGAPRGLAWLGSVPAFPDTRGRCVTLVGIVGGILTGVTGSGGLGKLGFCGRQRRWFCTPFPDLASYNNL